MYALIIFIVCLLIFGDDKEKKIAIKIACTLVVVLSFFVFGRAIAHGSKTQTTEIEIHTVVEIFEMEDKYVCVSKEETAVLVPKSVAVFNESEISEIIIEKKEEKLLKQFSL